MKVYYENCRGIFMTDNSIRQKKPWIDHMTKIWVIKTLPNTRKLIEFDGY